MIVKPTPAPADPTKVCKTCMYHDPDLHVCYANEYAIRDEDANTMSCSSWEPRKICITCGHFDPDTNECWFEEHDMSEEESLTRTCESWEPRTEKLNVFTATETIGMGPVNPAGVVPEAYGPVITECHTGDHRCKNCAYCNPETNHCTVRSRVMSSPGTTVCMQWAARVPLQPDDSIKFKAKETIGITISNLDNVTRATLKENTGWDHRLEAKALDRGAKQGMTQEALDTVFAIACQQVPSMEERWMELKAEITVMFAQKWAAEEMPK